MVQDTERGISLGSTSASGSYLNLQVMLHLFYTSTIRMVYTAEKIALNPYGGNVGINNTEAFNSGYQANGKLKLNFALQMTIHQ